MKRNPSDDELLRRYFLGEMSQEEAEELEERFGEDEFFELAEAIEGDLLAAAARRELAPAEREQVLKRLASSPQGRERFALARALNKAADEEKGTTPNVVRFPDRAPASRPASQWVTALAASLLVTAGLTWYAMERNRDGYAEVPAPQQQAQGNRHDMPPKAPEKQPLADRVQPVPAVPDQVARELERPVPEPVRPLGRAVLQLALAAHRDAAVASPREKLHIAPNVGIVELQVDVEGYETYESFDVALRNKEHDTIWQETGLEPQPLDWASALVLKIPAEKLAAAGKYEVQVQGRPAEEDAVKISLEFDVVTSGTP